VKRALKEGDERFLDQEGGKQGSPKEKKRNELHPTITALTKGGVRTGSLKRELGLVGSQGLSAKRDQEGGRRGGIRLSVDSLSYAYMQLRTKERLQLLQEEGGADGVLRVNEGQ